MTNDLDILGSVRAHLPLLARGEYQHDLVRGAARWSGADLRGKAAKWSGRYARSRAQLIERITDYVEHLGGAVSWRGGTSTTGPKRLVLSFDAGEIVI